MKQTSLILMFCAIAFFANAQDIITLFSGEEIKAHIVRVYPKEVSFTLDSKTDTLILQRVEIEKLKYKTGIVIYLNQPQKPDFTTEPFSDSLFRLGQRDASIYYKGYRPAATGTLISSFFIPWGLIPAIACSHTPPSMQNLDYQNQTLIQNPSYYKGYSENAYKIKKKKVWTGFAIGTGITLGIYIISFAAATAVYAL